MSDASEEFGPYLVYERLGQGGMATVHRAEKRGVGIRRPIALKRLLPHIATEPDLVKLFVDEARLASHLHHANVAQTYELGRVDDVFFIAMEYAPGPTLSRIMRQSREAAGEIPLTVTVNILTQICEALDYAHNLCDETGRPLRIIHRDVSPANIIVTSTGVVKLIDFGIAKTALSSVKTQTGFIKGKFGYIAPEYITGKIDARVDLFAVGVIAHEMLAGRRLFEGKDDFETLGNIREMEPLPPSHWNPHVTEDLDDIVMTALERDPGRRWQSAAAMQVALSNVARDFGLVVGAPQLAEWVDWAFRQAPGDDRLDRDADSGLATKTDNAGDAGAGTGTGADVGSGGTRPGWPSDSEETVPLERVLRAFNNLEVLTPPAMAAARIAARQRRTRVGRKGGAATPASPPRTSRAMDAAPPARASRSPDAGLSSPRASRAIEAVPPQEQPTQLAPRPQPPQPAQPPRPPQASGEPIVAAPPPAARASDAAMPAVVPSREIEVIVVPPGRMFEMPAQEAAAPAQVGKPPREARASRPPRGSGDADAPAGAALEPRDGEPGRARAPTAAGSRPRSSRQAVEPAPREHAPRRAGSIWWLILLMIALGAGAMAAAYYWPGDL
ncbi:MAG TPA: protein kinase [Kofleriaceae bacterium]|nr:protein kinase [Kofleriaceae bacterium]